MPTGRLLKTLSESFDGAQDERRRIDMIDDFPFMLRVSKHSENFFQQPARIIETRRRCRRVFASANFADVVF
jgi:hypothetical protein